MIPKSIVDALKAQDGEVERIPEDVPSVITNIEALGLGGHTDIEEFFSAYDLAGIASNKEIELLDLCSPSDEILETTEWARETYEVGKGFLCLTSGEGEGFVLYSKANRKVYDISVDELPLLKDGQISPRWHSFNELIEWYLS